MTITKHAQQRWEQRFPQFNLAAEYSRARGVGKKTKRRIARVVLSRPVMGPYRGIHYLRAPCGAIFVCGPKHFVITVIPEPPK